MEAPGQKLIIIINTNLPVGLVANTSAVLTLSVGAKHPELIGEDLVDGSGQKHMGITSITIPVLGADEDLLTVIAQKAGEAEVELVSFSKIAQSIHSYEEYTERLGKTLGEDITYSGIALYGDKKVVNSLTGSLPRLK